MSIGSHDYFRDKEAHIAVLWICKHQTAMEKKVGATFEDFSNAVGGSGDYLDYDNHLISAKHYDVIKEMG